MQMSGMLFIAVLDNVSLHTQNGASEISKKKKTITFQISKSRKKILLVKKFKP